MSELSDVLIDALQTKGIKGVAADIKTSYPPEIVAAIVGELIESTPRPGDPAPTLTTR